MFIKNIRIFISKVYKRFRLPEKHYQRIRIGGILPADILPLSVRSDKIT